MCKVPHVYEGKEVSNRLSHSPMILISDCVMSAVSTIQFLVIPRHETHCIAEHRHRLLCRGGGSGRNPLCLQARGEGVRGAGAAAAVHS